MDFTRSSFLTGVSALLAAPTGAAGGAASPLSAVDPDGKSRGTPAQALQFLCCGNASFVGGGTRDIPHPSQRTPQRPWATLLTCADTRVAPEIVFNTGFDDLFVCRTAGNIADNIVTGSIEYSIEHFHAPLVVVVAHSGCGACTAAVDVYDNRIAMPDESIASVVRAILPAVRMIPRNMNPVDRLRLVAKKNAELTATALARQTILKNAIRDGRLRVTWAYYDLSTGEVEIHGHECLQSVCVSH